MSRSGKVYIHDRFAGIILQDEEGYTFQYDEGYLKAENAQPASLTLTLRKAPYNSLLFLSF